jgi:hypothetical protein
MTVYINFATLTQFYDIYHFIQVKHFFVLLRLQSVHIHSQIMYKLWTTRRCCFQISLFLARLYLCHVMCVKRYPGVKVGLSVIMSDLCVENVHFWLNKLLSCLSLSDPCFPLKNLYESMLSFQYDIFIICTSIHNSDSCACIHCDPDMMDPKIASWTSTQNGWLLTRLWLKSKSTCSRQSDFTHQRHSRIH